MTAMHPLPSVEPAHPAERADAIRLAFRHLATWDQKRRVAAAMDMIRSGELDPAGLLVARQGKDLVGAVFCQPLPGAGGIIWLPHAVGPQVKEIEDRLVRSASAWMRQRGARLAQALLPLDDVPLATPLERNGYAHVTSLCYLRHDLELSSAWLGAAERLAFQPFSTGIRRHLEETLLRSYEATLDCPEINGVRTLEEILAGHRAGGFDPERWWLALDTGRPVGVLLVNEDREQGGWDVSYVGVVPEARRRGFGRELMRKALFEAKAGGVGQLTLAVDARNRPAWNLYLGMGFELYDQRAVYLAVWDRAQAVS